jgi:hypothetical protein
MSHKIRLPTEILALVSANFCNHLFILILFEPHHEEQDHEGGRSRARNLFVLFVFFVVKMVFWMRPEAA